MKNLNLTNLWILRVATLCCLLASSISCKKDPIVLPNTNNEAIKKGTGKLRPDILMDGGANSPTVIRDIFNGILIDRTYNPYVAEMGNEAVVAELGGDELTIIEICMDVEEEFQIEIFDEELEKLITIGQWVNFIAQRLSTVTITPGSPGGFPPPGTGIPPSGPPPSPPSGGGTGTGTPSTPSPTPYDCNCNCTPEDELADPNNVWEPKWGQLGSYATIRAEIIDVINANYGFNNLTFSQQLDLLQNHFNANRLFTKNSLGQIVDATGSKKVDRYLYTGSEGWMDMHHFFYAAKLSETYGSLNAILITSTAEQVQAHIKTQQSSAFSYEDLPSNYAGIGFWQQKVDAVKSGSKTLLEAVSEYLTAMSPKMPEEAPNYDYIPHILDNHVPKNTSTKGLTGQALKDAAKAEFCKKSAEMRNKIINAHIGLGRGSRNP